MSLLFKFLLAICCLGCVQIESANILGVFLFPSMSHQIVYLALCKELSLRGHQVTVITTDPLKDPNLVNLTEIDFSFSYEYMKYHKLLEDKLDKNVSMISFVKKMFTMTNEWMEKQLSHPDFQALYRDDNKTFDLFIVEYALPIALPLAIKHNCPMIGISSLVGMTMIHEALGNPTHPVLYPEPLLPFTDDELTFSQRVLSTLYEIGMKILTRCILIPFFDGVVREQLGGNFPSTKEMMKNFSMVFLNTNPILHPVRPHVPAIIELGNMHIKRKEPLPEDLQIELDAAENGAIYFSLGSNMRSSNLPQKTKDVILDVLQDLPYKVLWKWEDDSLINIPKNFMIRKWFPQQDILGHPNVKVFITQAGLQSMEEAIHNEVPCIALPIFGDQIVNAAKMAKLGFAITLILEKLDKQQFKEAILQVAQNETFRTNIKKVNELINDQPMTSMEKAVWWTEYVIRHKGAPHLRSPAVDIPGYKYYLLDVLSFLIICVLLIVYVTFKLLCFICKLCKKNNVKSSKIKTN